MNKKLKTAFGALKMLSKCQLSFLFYTNSDIIAGHINQYHLTFV